MGMLSASHAEEKSPKNHCEREASWKEWQALVAKHPDDQGLQTLHVLRIGLCVEVRRRELSVQQGTAIFEKARQALPSEGQETTQNELPKLLQP